MTKQKILIVEDEDNIRELIEYNLKKEGFIPIGVSNAEDAFKKIKNENLDLILLDIMLPGIDGLDFFKDLKSSNKTSKIPVVMVTAKGEESDIISGLTLGVDDYIVKPFSPKILIARIKNILRKRKEIAFSELPSINIHNIQIDPSKRKVLINNKQIELTNLEFMVLYLLASNPGRVYSRYQIVDEVRGDNYPVTERAVDVLIVGLRKKLDTYSFYIETVRGVGYRFKEEVSNDVA
jgi:two-component system phosphate regulon response regulator PhoB